MAKGVKLTREELYKKVWSRPMRTLAREFGLSDVGLKKTCRRHNIPTPGVGYWAITVEVASSVESVPRIESLLRQANLRERSVVRIAGD